MENEKVLLVWQMIPDKTELYEFDSNSDMAKLAISSAGGYINSVDCKDGHPVEQLNEELVKFSPLANSDLATGNYRTVVLCGFIL